MIRSFGGGIRIKKRIITESIQSRADFSSVTYTVREGAALAAKEGQTVMAGALLSPCDRDNAATICGISGRVTSVSENGDGTRLITVTAEQTDSYELEPAPAVPLSKSLKDCMPEELSIKLLERGVGPIRVGAKAPQVLTVNCGGSALNSLGVSLALQYPREIVGGAKILMKLFGVRKCIFAVPDTALIAAQSIERCLQSRSPLIKVSVFKDKYPSDPHLTVRATSGVEINAYKRPENAGYPVVDPRLCLQVYKALAEGESIYGALIYVTDADGEARLVHVPYGAPLNDVLVIPEGYTAVRAEAVFGCAINGSLMDRDVYAVATVKDNAYPAKENGDCISCGRCDGICPAAILPSRLYGQLKRGVSPRWQRDELLSCFECGCCSAVCPAALPLSETIAEGRTTAIKAELNAPADEDNDTVTEENEAQTVTASEENEAEPEENAAEENGESFAESPDTDVPEALESPESDGEETNGNETVDLKSIFKEEGENE